MWLPAVYFSSVKKICVILINYSQYSVTVLIIVNVKEFGCNSIDCKVSFRSAIFSGAKAAPPALK